MTSPGLPNPLIIDISEWNGTPNWAIVQRDGGVNLVIIRAGHGLAADLKIAQNAAGCTLPRTFYHFFHPEANPEQQAQRFYDLVRAYPRNCAPCSDFEPIYGTIYTLDWHRRNRAGYMIRARRYLLEVERLFNEKPIIYSADWCWPEMFLPPQIWEDEYEKWVADYYHSTPDLPPGWDAWRFWQCSSTGHIPGISTNVDINAFNGTMAEFIEYIGNPAPPAPPPFQPYQVRVIAAWLTVRSGPGVQYPRVGYLAYGATRWVREESGDGWGRIDTGWINLAWTRRI